MDRKEAKKLIKKAQKEYFDGQVEDLEATGVNLEFIERYKEDIESFIDVDEDNMSVYDSGVIAGLEMAIDIFFPKKRR